MTKMIKNLSKSNQANEMLLKLLLVAIFLLFVSYFYFMSVTVNAVVNNKQTLKNIQEVRNKYQELENKYFSLLGKFDMDYANNLGFVSRDKKIEYATRQSAFAQR